MMDDTEIFEVFALSAKFVTYPARTGYNKR